MYLSPRLQLVADLVDRGASLADIGCGHGKLCLYCLSRDIVSTAIAVDCSVGALDSARREADKLGYTLDCRLGDGLEPIAIGEADLAVIAGMGAGEIVGILSRAAYCVPTLILVPHKTPSLVRKYLHVAHYEIVYDAVVADGDFFYHVIKARAGADTIVADLGLCEGLDGPAWYIGADNRGNPHFAAYRAYRMTRLRQVIEQGSRDKGMLDELAALEAWPGE